MKLRVPIRRDTLRADSVAGLVLGVQSVPDGLASGLLAGVNPLAGLYAYMVGTITGAFFTSSAFMAVQATGAMSMVVADVPAVHDASDPARALFTLSLLTAVGFAVLHRLSAFYLPALVAGNQQQYGLLGVAFTLFSWLSACAFIIVVATVVGAVLAEDPGRIGQFIRALR